MQDWAIYRVSDGRVRMLITFGGEAVAAVNTREGEAAGPVNSLARPVGAALRYDDGELVPIEGEE